jgi:hypothetical protein
MSNRDASYFLCDHIQLTSPLGSLFNNESFRGVFDGNGKQLRGLVMRGPSLASFGLVRVLENGTFKNLIVVGPQVDGKGAVGVVAGLSSGRIENVIIDGGQVTSEKRPAGAIVGIQFSGVITGCQSTAFVTAEGQTGDQMVGVSFP